MSEQKTEPGRPATQHSVVVADPSPLVRDALVRLFSGDPRFRLHAAVGDGEAFLDAVDQAHVALGVIGWTLPNLSGQGVLNALRHRDRKPRIVVYAGTAERDVPRQVMAAGGAGFCSRDETAEYLLSVADAVARGMMVFPFVDVRTLGVHPLESLTAREYQLLAALTSGRSNAQLALELGISIDTVKFHLKNLYGKLAVRNRAQAAALFAALRPESAIHR
ncbi:MAG: response regulator transcription factor [Alphaproteobacteria bacterium]